jgi:glycosyltransferase involved in cell wall biosynthesis
MKVSIYNASWETIGGGEKYLCALADVISRDPAFSVTLLVDRPDLTKAKLQRFFDLALERVELMQVDNTTLARTVTDSDLAILQANWRPIPGNAPRNVYLMHLPYGPLGPATMFRRFVRGEFKEAAKDIFRKRLLSEARRATGFIVNSHFTHDVLLRHHGIASTVIQPPIDDFLHPAPKEKIILSAGRFFRGLYNDKRYDVMIKAFRTLTERRPDHGWEYWLAGSCSNDTSAQRHLDELKKLADGLPIVFHVNPSYAFLTECYNRSSLFWHAAGYGINEETQPERMEHFGMTTVEAMSARSVPIVYGGAGQREIVVPGTSGFFWSTPGELVSRTLALMDTPAMIETVADNARRRFADFSYSRFANDITTYFHELLAHHHGERT